MLIDTKCHGLVILSPTGGERRDVEQRSRSVTFWSANSSLTFRVSSPILQFTHLLDQISPKTVIVHYNLEHPNVSGVLLEGSTKTVFTLKSNFLRP